LGIEHEDSWIGGGRIPTSETSSRNFYAKLDNTMSASNLDASLPTPDTLCQGRTT